jgi:hypothetical protein
MRKPSSRIAEQPTQKPAHAEVGVIPRTTVIRVAGLLVCSIHSRFQCGSILDRGVARRSFGLLRHDLWLQIDPSISVPALVTS